MTGRTVLSTIPSIGACFIVITKPNKRRVVAQGAPEEQLDAETQAHHAVVTLCQPGQNCVGWLGRPNEAGGVEVTHQTTSSCGQRTPGDA